MGRLRDVRRKLAKRKGKRQYHEGKGRDLLNCIDGYFEKGVATSRMRGGECQEIETLINEEALLLAGYLRNEKQKWIPRLVTI